MRTRRHPCGINIPGARLFAWNHVHATGTRQRSSRMIAVAPVVIIFSLCPFLLAFFVSGWVGAMPAAPGAESPSLSLGTTVTGGGGPYLLPLILTTTISLSVYQYQSLD